MAGMRRRNEGTGKGKLERVVHRLTMPCIALYPLMLETWLDKVKILSGTVIIWALLMFVLVALLLYNQSKLNDFISSRTLPKLFFRLSLKSIIVLLISSE